jgi:hypothetical protein
LEGGGSVLGVFSIVDLTSVVQAYWETAIVVILGVLAAFFGPKIVINWVLRLLGTNGL